MSQPPDKYERIFDFTDFSAMQPDAQHPGQKIDQELNLARESINDTIDRLGEIQRDDGKIRASALDATEFQGIVDAATAEAEAAAASAATSATTATTKASEASASALSASNSATSASASAGSVAAQVATATTAATNANTSAADAAISAADALTSKNSAFSSASSATSSAGAAAGSAIAAATSANNAANSASAAASSASTASIQASAAAGSATAAAGSATAAASSATAAANSAASINPSAYAQLSGATFTGDVFATTPSPGTNSTRIATTEWVKDFDYAPTNSPHFTGNPKSVTPNLSDNDTSISTTAFVKGQGYLTSAPVTSVAGKTGAVSLVVGDVSGAAPLASPALTGNVTITTNSASPALFVTQTGTGNILTLHDQAADTTFVAIDQNGKVNTVPAVTTGAGFNVPHGVAPTSGFVNGDIWSTTGGLFARITNATQQVAFQSWVVSQGYMTLSSALNAFSLKVAPVYQDFSQVAGVYDYHNGALINLFYNGGTDGRVAFYDGLPAGSKIQFYQDEQATQPITFNGAFNRENKLMTLGPKSQVTALKTFAGWLLYGDLQFPANGTLISEECAYWSGSDAVGTFWDGNYLHRITYADGSGGTYTSESLGGGTCYLPYGYCIESGVNISESTVSWSGCSSSGTATYSSSAGNIRADGYGGVYQETTGGYSAQYGDVIYDSYNGCVVKHDGMGGYFVEDNSGSGSYPSYGTYLGNVSGDLYIYYPDTGENFLAGSYSEDQYADGSGGVAYTENRYDSWYSYGTYLGYDYNFGQTIYADGYGSYYLS